MNPLTFDYMAPTEEQVELMGVARKAAQVYAEVIDQTVLDGPDKTYLLRKLREVAMWVNVAITRHPDGTPRQELEVSPKDYPSDHPVKGDLGSIPL
jgi:hypothetical protein